MKHNKYIWIVSILFTLLIGGYNIDSEMGLTDSVFQTEQQQPVQKSMPTTKKMMKRALPEQSYQIAEPIQEQKEDEVDKWIDRIIRLAESLMPLLIPIIIAKIQGSRKSKSETN